jgi:hypothetical protein
MLAQLPKKVNRPLFNFETNLFSKSTLNKQQYLVMNKTHLGGLGVVVQRQSKNTNIF